MGETLGVIVSSVPPPLTAWRGLLPPLALLLVWDVVVTLAYVRGWLGFGEITIQYTLYGTAVALFLGFMVNAAYARWWEARTLWGTITNHSRNLAREASRCSTPPSRRPGRCWSPRSSGRRPRTCTSCGPRCGPGAARAS